MSQNHGAANILGCHRSLAEIISSLATYLLKKDKNKDDTKQLRRDISLELKIHINSGQKPEF